MSPLRLHLRALAASDAVQVLAWRNSPQVAEFMYGDHAISPEEHAAWLAATLARDDRRYWIIEVDGAPCGVAHVIGTGEHGRGEWGSYLADPALRGRGIGTAVEFTVLRWAFETRGLRKLWVEVLARNASAWALHLEFGFVREATFRAHAVKAGEALDAYGFGLLAAEWPVARARAEARLRDRGWAPEDLTIDA